MQPGRGPPMAALTGLDASGDVDAELAQSPTVAAAEAKASRASAVPVSPATTASSPFSSDVDAKPVNMEKKLRAASAGAQMSPTALAMALAPVKTAAGKQVFRCSFPGCGREFQLKGNLKRHLNIHSGEAKFQCAFCGRAFLRKADMEVHTRVHTGEKPHACRFPGCDRSFARRSDLLSHERTHTGAKPFECAFPGCGRRFARKFDLHKHQRMHEAAAGDKAKPKKRRLASSTSSSSMSPASSPCASPNPRAAAMGKAAASAGASANAKTGPKGAVRQCIQCGTTAPTTAAAAPAAPVGKPAVRYELTCTEDHVHSPPACFAAFNVVDSIDAFLAGEDAPDLRSLSLLDLNAPSIGPCCQTGHVFAPLPSHGELLGVGEPITVGAGGGSMHPDAPRAIDATAQALGALPVVGVPLVATSATGGSLMDTIMGGGDEIRTNATGTLTMPVPATESKTTDGRKLTLQDIMTLPTDPEPQPMPLSAGNKSNVAGVSGLSATAPSSAMPVCVPVPETVDPVLNYSRHSRSCGHLSIQHGNHRDYVVQNHLVCQDSIKKLGERSRSGSNCSSNGTASATGSSTAKCAPKDSHGPGCGHLPVRHHDHIDYVVEDNLFCQRKGWLDDADNIELLDDDFWEFYGAIGSLNTDEQQLQQLKEEQKDSDPNAGTAIV